MVYPDPSLKRTKNTERPWKIVSYLATAFAGTVAGVAGLTLVAAPYITSAPEGSILIPHSTHREGISPEEPIFIGCKPVEP